MEYNEIEGITSDCARSDNGVGNIVQYNTFLSYTGNQNNKAPKGENNGIQIADAGSSHGYNASNKPTHTTNIEVRYNTFANTGTEAINLDSTGKGYDNVYCHDNVFAGVSVFTNDGENVSIDITSSNASLPTTDLTKVVKPTKEMTEKIFNSIFDIFFIDTVEYVDKNDTVYVGNETYQEADQNAIWDIEQHNLGNISYTLITGSTAGLTGVQYEINGKTEKRVLMLGERQGMNVIYTNVSVWRGDIPHVGESIKVAGLVEPEDIKITCETPRSSFNPDMKKTVIEKPGMLFNPMLFLVLGIISIFVCGSGFIIYLLFKKW